MARVTICWVILLGAFAQLVLGAERKTKIVTTFAPAYSLVASIVGDKAEVSNLLPANASLHDYTLSPGDMRKLHSAEIVVMNGAGLETWFGKALRVIENKPSVQIIALSQGLEKQLIESHHGEHHHDHKHDHGEYNPHLWLDPVFMMHAASNITSILIVRDPANAEAYKANSTAFTKTLQTLHNDYQREVLNIKSVAFLTYHNAFAYLARRYELKLVGVIEEVPEVSPSPRQLKGIYDLIKSKRVKVLFSEPGFRTRLAEQIGRDGKVLLAELDPFETGELAPGAYEKVMRKNLKTLQEQLSQ